MIIVYTQKHPSCIMNQEFLILSIHILVTIISSFIEHLAWKVSKLTSYYIGIRARSTGRCGISLNRSSIKVLLHHCNTIYV
jgi:hypothetical protein